MLARLPDAPEDVKGISLFVVPKVLEGGSRNAVQCIGLEHKLGIHASPTCTMDFDGATGYLLGGENEGLKCMFTMMNNARLSVGLQGVAIAEASYQAARDFAQERVQGKSFESGERVAIAEHADVQRMLMSMKAQIEAGRALTYDAAIALDKAMAGDETAQAKVDFLTPIVKSWCTDMACEVTSIGIQVFGGMGFIEETGAAQFMRDARILPIYEGTNGIQAADLVFRKIIHDGGKAAQIYIDGLDVGIPESDKGSFSAALSALRDATKVLLKYAEDKKMDGAAAAAVSYLNGFAIIAGGALLARAAVIAEGKGDDPFYKDKIETSEFYIANILPHAKSWLEVARKDQ